jgi:hypothetical protein
VGPRAGLDTGYPPHRSRGLPRGLTCPSTPPGHPRRGASRRRLLDRDCMSPTNFAQGGHQVGPGSRLGQGPILRLATQPGDRSGVCRRRPRLTRTRKRRVRRPDGTRQRPTAIGSVPIEAQWRWSATASQERDGKRRLLETEQRSPRTVALRSGIGFYCMRGARGCHTPHRRFRPL